MRSVPSGAGPILRRRLFGALAVALSCMGLYGVLAHLVARRTRELGIRSALGATRASVMREVILDGIGLVAMGIVLGIPPAIASSRWISALLFGVAPFDPPTLALTAALFGLVATVAGALPAYRASRVNPIVVLRCE